MSDMATTAGGNGSTRNWTFLTNHGHVLLAIARNPTARLRDVADEVGVTERAAQAIVADLEAGGYLRRTRVGRRNEYTVNPSGHFRHPAEADRQVGDLLALFTTDQPERDAPHQTGHGVPDQAVGTTPDQAGQRAPGRRTPDQAERDAG